MRDGNTQKIRVLPIGGDAKETAHGHVRISLVLITGDSSGDAYELRKTPVILGRGPGVDIAIDDPTMSRQHLILEMQGAGFHARDLGSTNGVTVNGKPIDVAVLVHGDSVQVGAHEFTYIVEEATGPDRIYEVPA